MSLAVIGKLMIGSNPTSSYLKKDYFNLYFRKGILEENAEPTHMPRNEMSMSLTLDEAEVGGTSVAR
jgi:hypothetical protein